MRNISVRKLQAHCWNEWPSNLISFQQQKQKVWFQFHFHYTIYSQPLGSNRQFHSEEKGEYGQAICWLLKLLLTNKISLSLIFHLLKCSRIILMSVKRGNVIFPQKCTGIRLRVINIQYNLFYLHITFHYFFFPVWNMLNYTSQWDKPKACPVKTTFSKTRISWSFLYQV